MDRFENQIGGLNTQRADFERRFTGTTDAELAGHFNRVQSKHVDFLICGSQLMRPLAAVELDDASREADARQERDASVDRVLAAAGLPLVRVPASHGYVPDMICDILWGAQRRNPGERLSG